MTYMLKQTKEDKTKQQYPKLCSPNDFICTTYLFETVCLGNYTASKDKIKNKENIGKTLSDINHSRILYDPPPRVMEIKAKVNKWDLIKLKSFCTMKETISTVKRQPSDWEKIIANEATDKELISKIY